MSLVRRPLNLWLRLTEKRALARLTDPRPLRRKLERTAKLLFHGPRMPSAWQEIAGRPALHLSGGQSGPRMLYFHGGAYMFGSPSTHSAMLASLAQRVQAEAILPSYRLAPEHPFPAAIDDALDIYRATTGPVILGGDSAGGGLALALLGEILRRNLPKPLGLFAFSPITDAHFTAPSLTENAQSEVFLPATQIRRFIDLVLAGQDPADPRISPLFADFTGAPPVALFASNTEILLDDSRNLAEKLRSQGVATQLTVERGLPHVWPLFHNILPEARTTLDDVAGWIRSLPPPSGN